MGVQVALWTTVFVFFGRLTVLIWPLSPNKISAWLSSLILSSSHVRSHLLSFCAWKSLPSNSSFLSGAFPPNSPAWMTCAPLMIFTFQLEEVFPEHQHGTRSPVMLRKYPLLSFHGFLSLLVNICLCLYLIKTCLSLEIVSSGRAGAVLICLSFSPSAWPD